MRRSAPLVVIAWLAACTPANDSGNVDPAEPAGTNPAQPESNTAESNTAGRRASVAAGAELADAWCGNCHATGSAGEAADIGPTWAAINADPRFSDAYLQSFLTAPHGPMESLSLSRQQIKDLIAYIRSLSN